MKLAMRSAVLTAAMAAFVFPALAGATTINVSVATDTSADDGQCTLREAITAANTNADVGPTDAVDCPAGSATLDTIVLPAGDYAVAGANGEDANASGDLDIDLAGGPLEISGADPATTIIHSAATDRVLDLHGDGALTITSTKVFNGLVAGTGAGINAPDGADLTINRSVIDGNRSEGATGTESGGGVYIGGGSLTVDHSTISANQVNFTGNAGTLDGSILAGGGIYAAPGTSVTVDYSTITDNKVNSSNKETFVNGGGISVANASEPVSIKRSLIQKNSTDLPMDGAGTNLGAGIAYTAASPAETLTLENDSFFKNKALSSIGTNASGGGLYVSGGTAKAANLTFGAENDGALNYAANGGTFSVRGTVFALECSGDDLDSLGFNIEQDANTANTTCGLDQPTDKFTGAALGQLIVKPEPEDNGGPTLTFSLLNDDSPARDAIPAADCLDTDGNHLETDQRSVGRAAGEPCDAGAYQQTYCGGDEINVVGTDGPDTLMGTTADDAIIGLGGNDTFQNLDLGNDKVCGGEGDDVYLPDSDGYADTFDGGPGNDWVNTAAIDAPANITVGAGTGSVTAPGLGTDLLLSVENGVGGERVDNLVGDETVNQLVGNGGGDRIVPGAGADTVIAGSGQDQIFVRDGVSDSVDCGTEVDTIESDNKGVDAVTGCEVTNYLDNVDPNSLYNPVPPQGKKRKAVKCPKGKKLKKLKKAKKKLPKKCRKGKKKKKK
jgi:CSLREA domain-containing protein